MHPSARLFLDLKEELMATIFSALSFCLHFDVCVGLFILEFVSFHMFLHLVENFFSINLNRGFISHPLLSLLLYNPITLNIF